MMTDQTFFICGDLAELMQNFITSGIVRQILSIEKRPINIRTMDRLIDAGLLEVVDTMEPTDTRLFERKKVEELAAFFPKKRMPSRYGIIDYVKQKMKEKEKSAHAKKQGF